MKDVGPTGKRYMNLLYDYTNYTADQGIDRTNVRRDTPRLIIKNPLLQINSPCHSFMVKQTILPSIRY